MAVSDYSKLDTNVLERYNRGLPFESEKFEEDDLGNGDSWDEQAPSDGLFGGGQEGYDFADDSPSEVDSNNASNSDYDDPPAPDFDVPDLDPPSSKPQGDPPSSQQRQPSPPPSLLPWTEEQITTAHGIDLGGRRFQLNEYDDQSPEMDSFRERISRVANEFNVNPGLLLVNALTEAARGFYLNRRTPVESYRIGLDYWDTSYTQVISKVPRANGLRGNRIQNADGTFETFENEQGINTGYVRVFRNGLEATRALAAYVKYAELKLIDHVGSEAAWNMLSRSTQFLLIRYFLNASPRRSYDLATRAVAGEDIRITSGPAGEEHPQRSATIRAGQAIRWSEILGQPIDFDL